MKFNIVNNDTSDTQAIATIIPNANVLNSCFSLINPSERNMKPFDLREMRILKDVYDYFTPNVSNDKMELFLNIISKKTKSKMSIRIIDWFVTFYSKDYNINYAKGGSDQAANSSGVTSTITSIDEIINCSNKNFYVKYDYAKQIKYHKKDYFDPFCRKRKITCVCKYETCDLVISTSIGQLNFFRWAIQNDVIKYVSEHLAEINTAMRNTTKIGEQRKRIIASERQKIENGLYAQSASSNKINIIADFGMSLVSKEKILEQQMQNIKKINSIRKFHSLNKINNI